MIYQWELMFPLNCKFGYFTDDEWDLASIVPILDYRNLMSFVSSILPSALGANGFLTLVAEILKYHPLMVRTNGAMID